MCISWSVHLIKEMDSAIFCSDEKINCQVGLTVVPGRLYQAQVSCGCLPAQVTPAHWHACRLHRAGGASAVSRLVAFATRQTRFQLQLLTFCNHGKPVFTGHYQGEKGDQ